MKTTTKVLILSIVVYSTLIGLTVYAGGLWLFLTAFFVLGLGYDVHSYIRLKNGKGILTYQGVLNYYKNRNL